MVDSCGAWLYVPNANQTALLQGDWLSGHVQSGIVTVLSAGKELQRMKEERFQGQISILKCPKFWRESGERPNLRSNFKKGREKIETEWEYLYNTDCDICKLKNICTKECKYRAVCKLYVIKAEEGVVKIRRLCKNAKLPVRGPPGSAGYDLAAAQSAVVPADGKYLVKTICLWLCHLFLMVE